MPTAGAAPAGSGEVPRHQRRLRRRVLMFPLPFQGHVTPMLQLADVLRARVLGAVTVFHAAFAGAPAPAGVVAGRHRLVPVGAGVPASDLLPTGSDADFVGAVLRIDARLREPFRESLRGVLAEDEEAPACLVVDSNLRGMQEVAEGLGVPTLALRTGGAACLVAYMAFPALCGSGVLPPPPPPPPPSSQQDRSRLDMPLEELPPLRLRDMVFSTTTTHDDMTACLQGIVDSARFSSGVIINTFAELENPELEKIAHGLGVPVHAVGPLHKMSSGTESSLLAQDRSCLEWLDEQEPQSVLYVSFGSLSSMDERELAETAWGLAGSGRPFLWVVRPDSVRHPVAASLPDGFEAAARGRGVVVPWAPQREVLAHRAVGGFWTHGGWNSTLESVCQGVPMICRPQFADQMINARYVAEVWHVGFELEGELERRRVGSAVRKLLCEEEGEAMRRRAKALKKKAGECVRKGGSSEAAVDSLVSRILSL